MRVKKPRTELELFMRKLAEVMQIGFQFHYGTRHWSGDKLWSVEIWDQRPGHYRYGHENPELVEDENGNLYELGYGNSIVNGHGIQDSPHIHWYPKLRSDRWFRIDSAFREHQKDEFIEHILFKSDIFKRIAKEIPGMPESLSELLLKKAAMAGKDIRNVVQEYGRLKAKHGEKSNEQIKQ